MEAIRWPSTSMPLVEPRSRTRSSRSPPEPPTWNSMCRRLMPGVVDPDVGLGAAADDHRRRVQRVLGAVDLDERRRPAYLGVGGVAAHLRLRLAADPEPAGGEVLGGLEVDADRAREDVALVVGVVLELVAQLARHRGVVRREPLEVGLGELHVEAGWAPSGGRGRGSARCCRTRAGGPRRSRPAAPRCGTPWRTRRRWPARDVARSSAVRPRVASFRSRRVPRRPPGDRYRCGPRPRPTRWRGGARFGEDLARWDSLAPLLARVAE